MKKFLKQNQFTIFVLLTFVLSWFPWYAGIAPEVINIGPSLAAVIVVIIIGRKSGLFDLLRPFLCWRVRLGYWGIAIFGIAVLYMAGLGTYIILGGEPPPFIMIREELNLIPLYLILVVLSPSQGPVGEEFGWRGYALQTLQNKYGPLIASLVIGIIWGIWHVPTFFSPTGVLPAMVSAIGFIFIVPYTLGTIANSIFMTWLYNKTNASALIAGVVWHAAINFWAPILLSDSSLIAAGEGNHLPTIAPNLYLTVLAILVLGAIILVIQSKGQLGYKKKVNENMRDWKIL